MRKMEDLPDADDFRAPYRNLRTGMKVVTADDQPNEVVQ